jgi:arylsulfatase A-like enzyme
MSASRRDFLKWIGLSGASLSLVLGKNHAGAVAEERPNVLWIYSDDHSHNAVSAYAGLWADVAPTPNIDRIANQGVIFRNSFVTNSICGPCRAVVLTGKHSHVNGFMRNGDRFNGTQQTFPKLLQRAGYQTAIFGKWHLGTEPTGFDDWDVLPGQGHYYNPEFLTPEGREVASGYVTDIITSKALSWLKNKRDEKKPFMLMVQHKAPHREWEPGPAHLRTFDDVTIPEPGNLFDDYAGRGTAAREQDMTIEETMRISADLKVWDTSKFNKPIEEMTREEAREKRWWERTYARMDEEQRKQWDTAYGPKNEAFRKADLQGRELVRWKYQRYMKDYLRCIRSIDDNVGRILDYLEESGLDKNTVVFYSSDQGFYLGEHGWFDKRFMYEESLRTPLLAKWPGVANPGTECTAMVQNLDYAETFLDIAGVPIPDDMQGASLVPFMKGRTPLSWRKSIYYHYYEGEGRVHHVHRHYGIRNARYKLIHFYTLDEWELYNLQTDPKEMQSQYDNPKYASVVREMKSELEQLRVLYQVPADP